LAVAQRTRKYEIGAATYSAAKATFALNAAV